MSIQGLGYVGVRTNSVADWATYGRDFLGLQLVDRSRKGLAFRMDDRRQRIVIDEDGGEGVGFFGWEVLDAAGLDAVAARLEAAGVPVARGSRALAQERHVTDLIVFQDPAGNRLEVFHGPEVASEAFQPGRNISGFRTGALGMGHAVITVERLAEVMPFYQNLLGFRLSDYASVPFNIYFFHVNPRHHSFAFAETGKNGVHHLMMELYSLDDVGQGYDLAQGLENIGTTLGRHTNDLMTSFYAYTPSRFMIEYGWGGRVIDDSTWKVEEMHHGPSLWGHERNWLPPEAQARARAVKLNAAREGQRAPVQVLAGNHELMPGACPWWDYVRGLQAAE
jgi:2,3-dihydroxybiphenyl 1,2-dioxygenase